MSEWGVVLHFGRGDLDCRNDEEEGSVMARIGTMGIGRVGGLGDDCPTGFFLDPEGAVCLPITPETTGNLPDVPTDVTLPPPPTPSLPPITSGPVYTGLPLSLPPVFAPTGVTATPGVGLSVPVSCPTGYVQSGGVCVPSSPTTLIPGIPNWAIYGGIGFLALMAMSGMSRGGGRR